MGIFKTYFDSIQVSLLLFAGLSLIISIYFYYIKRHNISILFLALTAALVFCFAALLDPFLNIWDERFHALVAKNLSQHPLKPTLYDNPIVQMAYDRWDRSHIWLHKQPLFLWQMALSYKIFGPSEFALRIPNIIMGVTLVVITYRSGKLLINSTTGYISSILLLTSFFFNELIAGRQMVDHNDVAFVTYVSLSIWSFLELEYSARKKIWIILIGLFSGLAILNKWLPGLVVYFGWTLLLISKNKFKIKEFKDLLVSFSITVLIALPWQIYILIKFPEEAANAYSYNTAHFFEVIEGHSGNIWFYLDQFNILYGNAASFLILPGFIILFYQMKNKKMFFSLLGIILVVYIFFSIAKTKMPSYTLMVAMLIYIALGTIVNFLVLLIEKYSRNNWINKLVLLIIIVFLVASRYDIELYQEKHTSWKKENLYTPALMHNKKLFTSLNLPQNTVLFNVRGVHYVEAMYYTGFTAYKFIPTFDQYMDLKNKGINIAIFNTNLELPDYLQNDSSVIIIRKKIEGYD